MITKEYRHSITILLQVKDVSKTFPYADKKDYVILNRVGIDFNDGKFVMKVLTELEEDFC